MAAPDVAQAPPAKLRIHFDGANPAPAIAGKDRQSAEYHYYGGNDPSQWRTHVPTYAGIVYQGLYDGIDLEYNGGSGYLEGTYVVAPQQIRRASAGATTEPTAWRFDFGNRASRITMPVLDRIQAQRPVWKPISSQLP